MNILFVNFASHRHTLSAVTHDRVCASYVLADHRDDSLLLPALASVLAQASWTYADITHIACVAGPGGFMSLRTGVSLANALSSFLDLPSTSVHVSSLLAETCSVSTTDCLWLHSTKQSQLFVRGFGVHALRWPEPTLVSLDDLRIPALVSASYFGELIAAHAATLPVAALPLDASAHDARLPSFLASLPYVRDRLLLPWYGREP